MISNQHPPRKKKPVKEKQPPAEAESPGRTPGAEAPGEGQSAGSENPSREEVVRSWSDPVTNQDEEEKITNAGEKDLPIADK